MNDNDFQLGTAKVRITPKHSVPLAGFMERTGTYEAISKHLYARIWCFEQTCYEGKLIRSLLIQADLIWWGALQVQRLRQMIKTKFGIESVLFHATHTHSGPQTEGTFTPSLGLMDEDYMQWLDNVLMQGIKEAIGHLVPVHIDKGTGQCRIGIHRRRVSDGKVEMAPNPDGIVDPEVQVFRFVDLSGNLKGILFHYTCHPTTTKENKVSSEFPGAAMEHIEAALDDSAMAVFLQGFCGDVRPALIHDGEFYNGSEEDVNTLGIVLGEEVLKVLNQPMQRLTPSLREACFTNVMLPMISVPDQGELKNNLTNQDITSEWSRVLLEHPHRNTAEIPLELSLYCIAEGLSFIAMNGEMVLDYGLAIKHKSNGSVLPLGYSNGMIGYVPTAEQLAEGGYESKDSLYYFGLPGPFAPELEGLIEQEVEILLSTISKPMMQE